MIVSESFVEGILVEESICGINVVQRIHVSKMIRWYYWLFCLCIVHDLNTNNHSHSALFQIIVWRRACWYFAYTQKGVFEALPRTEGCLWCVCKAYWGERRGRLRSLVLWYAYLRWPLRCSKSFEAHKVRNHNWKYWTWRGEELM